MKVNGLGSLFYYLKDYTIDRLKGLAGQDFNSNYFNVIKIS